MGLFNCYIAFVFFAVMNVMTGVFCNKAIESAQKDEDVVVNLLLLEREKITRKLQAVFQDTFDDDKAGMITLSEFEDHLRDEGLKAWFASIDIDVKDGWTLFKLLDVDRTGLIQIQDFVVGCLNLRGHAKKIDIRQLMYEQRRIMTKLDHFDQKLDRMAERLPRISGRTSF